MVVVVIFSVDGASVLDAFIGVGETFLIVAHTVGWS